MFRLHFAITTIELRIILCRPPIGSILIKKKKKKNFLINFDSNGTKSATGYTFKHNQWLKNFNFFSFFVCDSKIRAF